MKKNKGGDNNILMQSIDRIYNLSSISGTIGNHYLKLYLSDYDIIITQLGSLICMNSGIEKADLHYEGFLHGFSKVLAGEPLYYQIYKGKKNIKGGFIYLGSNFINSIIAIKINNGEIFRLSRNCFLASTGNIKISFTFQAKGIFEIGQEEGFFLPTATCIEGKYGYIWLCAYGNLEKIIVPKNDYLIIDNGIFLACNNNFQYEISKLGKSLFSSLFGGEGFGMKFIGVDNDTHIYIQTKNVNDFLVKETTTTDNSTGELLENAINLFTND
jgi:uncharacterized protein (AIM24 family)